MKKIIQLLILFFSLSITAQNLDKNWSKVYEYEYAGKIKSASEELNKIYKKARKNNDQAEIIRTFIYQSKFLQTLQEGAQYKIIKNLRDELLTKDEANKAIFNFIYGKLLSDYYQQNRYKLKQQTATESIFDSDFRTWSSTDFEKEITNAYENSIKNEAILLKTPLNNYKKIIVFGEYEAVLNQSLYDFLTQKYIEYRNYNRSYSEEISKEEKVFFNSNISSFYAETKEFGQLNLEKYKSSLLYKKLIIYQKLENNYAFQGNISALSNTILKRIRTIYAEHERPEEYLAALEKFIVKTESKYQSIFLLEKAKTFQNNASKDKNPDYNLKAIAICNDLILKADEPFSSEAKMLKSQILNKSLSITSAKYIIPNQPNLALVRFMDIDTIYGTLHKIPLKFALDDQYNYNSYINDPLEKDSLLIDFINKNKPYKTFKSILPNKDDHFEHSTEIILPEMENGIYLLVMSIKKDNLSKKSTYTSAILNASELSVVYSNSENTEKFQVLNRKTGKPVENAVLKSEDYTIKTDSNGMANYERTIRAKSNHQALQITKAKDTLLHEYYTTYYYKSSENEENENFRAKIALFTDRAIYRPGQTVYFKGILFQTKRYQKNIVPNIYVSITVENENREDIYKSRLKTNEFGSFIGEFNIPKNMLTGDFTIIVDEDEEYKTDEQYNTTTKEHPFWDNVDFEYSKTIIKVEEYKRPKFEVTFEPIKENFIVNQKIKIKGKAKAFAGSNISDAKVTYTVNRNSYYNNWYYSRQSSLYENEQITEGTTITDQDGNFEIEFTAIPAEGFDEKGLPVFNFSVKADVTDINGETRSNNTQAKVGYHTLVLNVRMPKTINTKSVQKIALDSQNLNDQFVPAIGKIQIFKSKSPTRILNSRQWEAPEIQTIPENEFVRLFPTLPYANQNDSDMREKGDLVFSENIDTKKSKEVVLKDLKKWDSGEYQLFFTAKDAFGKEIETRTNFTLSNDTDKNLADNQLFLYGIVNADPKKDGFIEIQYASAAPTLYITTNAFNKGQSIFNKVIEVNGKKAFKIPIRKEWTNDVNITMNFTWENENFNQQHSVYLPKLEENISIEASSFRNKIEPGSNETWSFLIKDQQEKGIAAEALASMYDASLDQFYKSRWDTKLDFYDNDDYNIKSKQFLGATNLASLYFRDLSHNRQWRISYSPSQLNWFGFNFMQQNQYDSKYQQYLAEKVVESSGINIKGIVSEDGIPLSGVFVKISNRDREVFTDSDGRFEIKALIGEILELEYPGMRSQFVKINDKIMKIDMVADATMLETVVIDSYHTKSKKNSLTAATTVTSETLEWAPSDSSLQMLQSQVAGLNIVNASGQPGSGTTVILRCLSSVKGMISPLYVIDGVALSEDQFRELDANDILNISVLKDAGATAIYGNRGANGVVIINTKKAQEALSEVKARKNLSETAFFFPQLRTDEKGNLKFSFKSPEALTQWKLRLFAHNKKAVSAYLENYVMTQKDLMVLPNVPRFLREKDTIVITSKISNITADPKTGIAMLQLFDAVTMEPVDTKMLNTDNIKNFSIKANGNTIVSWKLFVPEGLQGVHYKILAKAGDFTDGEENILPVLTNNILVTESMPLWVRSNTKKEYTFENFKNNQSITLRNHLLTLEYTSNPAWYAIQSLPYLMDYEHECAEQTFSRYYAHVLANEIITSNPKIAAVFEAWRKSGKPISKLEQNEELKSLILAETPWVKDAESEEQQKKNLALLFDLEKIKTDINDNFEKLDKKQSPSGGFAWFAGGNDSEYITRHIVAGLGHLEKLKVSNQNSQKFKRITAKAIPFIEEKFLNRDRNLEIQKKKNKIWNYDTYADLHFLYARSFYLETYPIKDSLKKTIEKHIDHTKKHWLQYGLYEKAMASLILNRFGEKEVAKKILVSLKETSINNDENGMYWINNKAGWYWYQAPIETQALLIEAFSEITEDKKSVEAMKTWLLKNRQTKSWNTTKATTEAIYALLLQGEDWISVKENTVIQLGDEKIMTKKLAENEKEAGSGYIKMSWKADEITKDMATISINNKSNVTGFGGFYWQYFEDLDKIKPSQESPLSIEKELYIKENTPKGKELQKITNAKALKIGDLVTVRLIVHAKENMEFVHLKDMRAAAFEPVDVLSEYKWQGGLGYYMSTKDAATHFFFDNISKGKYVLEYDVRVNNIGEFSNGITTIQSMYAPEFSSHSKGIRVKVKE